MPLWSAFPIAFSCLIWKVTNEIAKDTAHLSTDTIDDDDGRRHAVGGIIQRGESKLS